MLRTGRLEQRLPCLRPVWLVPMRLTARAKAQLGLPLIVPKPQLPTLDQRIRGTEFIGLTVRRVANPPEATGMTFWSINPYVGCEFGCAYCYARDTHRWTSERNGKSVPGIDPRVAFERQIFVKQNAADVLRRTLDPAKVGNRVVLIGTATDPYQPAERRFGISRSVLEALQGYRGLRISITTKSPLVARDADILKALSARHRVSVNLSIISLDPELIRRLEPRTPLPHARLRGVRALADAGLDVGLMIAPIIPGLTDGWDALGRLMAAGKEAGARRADGFALRLGPVARSGFLPLLEREFPGLVARYRHRYRNRPDVGSDYDLALTNRLRSLQKIHNFPPNRFGAPTPSNRPEFLQPESSCPTRSASPSFPSSTRKWPPPERCSNA